MNAYKNDSFNERLTAAAKARKAALEKFRARPGPDDPAVLERQAAQKAIAVAREARMAERADLICRAFGAQAKFRYERRYPATINTARCRVHPRASMRCATGTSSFAQSNPGPA